jgi:hypothetical protein
MVLPPNNNRDADGYPTRTFAVANAEIPSEPNSPIHTIQGIPPPPPKDLQRHQVTSQQPSNQLHSSRDVVAAIHINNAPAAPTTHSDQRLDESSTRIAQRTSLDILERSETVAPLGGVDDSNGSEAETEPDRMQQQQLHSSSDDTIRINQQPHGSEELLQPVCK